MLEKAFNHYREKYPGLGDVIIMYYVVAGNNLSRTQIVKCFNKMVSKEEYEESEKKELIDFLLSKSQDTGLKQPL